MREETRCQHMGYSFRLTARVLLYAPSHRQDSTYHDLCYTSCGALAETRRCCNDTRDLGMTCTHVERIDSTPLESIEREREMFYLTTHSTHFIYGYMESDIWLIPILIVRKETRCRHMGYSYRLTARVLLYAPSQALAGTRNSSMGPPHEGSIR